METFIEQLDISRQVAAMDQTKPTTAGRLSIFRVHLVLAACEGSKMPLTTSINNRTPLHKESNKIAIEPATPLNPKPDPVLRRHRREPD